MNDRTEEPNGASDYGASSIKVLKGLDAVRKRPGSSSGPSTSQEAVEEIVNRYWVRGRNPSIDSQHVYVDNTFDGVCQIDRGDLDVRAVCAQLARRASILQKLVM